MALFFKAIRTGNRNTYVDFYIYFYRVPTTPCFTCMLYLSRTCPRRCRFSTVLFLLFPRENSKDSTPRGTSFLDWNFAGKHRKRLQRTSFFAPEQIVRTGNKSYRIIRTLSQPFVPPTALKGPTWERVKPRVEFDPYPNPDYTLRVNIANCVRFGFRLCISMYKQIQLRVNIER